MAEVLAGFVCGFGLALIVTPIAAIALVRARLSSPLLQRLVPEGTSLVAISIILNSFAVLTLTALGILLGLLLLGLETSNPAGGLGSPNGAFTGFVLIASAIALAPPALFFRALRRPLLASGFFFVVLFGWLMPYLSLLGPEG